MRTGKIPPEILNRTVFPHLKISNKNIVIGPAVGEDAAAVLNEGKYLIVSTDPITGTEKGIGKYLVNINANDIASMGAEPKYLTLNILLPTRISEQDLKRIVCEASEEADNLGINIIGGHTEVTNNIEKVILVGCMIGFSSHLLKAESIKGGDKIILTKGAGLEGTSILAQNYPTLLRSKGLSEKILNQAAELREQISIVQEALISRDKAIFMHDPTEGGIQGGLHELCDLSNKGFEVSVDRITVSKPVKEVCETLNVDPLKLIGSGGLIIVATPENSEKITAKLAENNIPASEIGEITDSPQTRNLPAVVQDELWRICEKLEPE